MTEPIDDILIVGAGPAGTSAALALVERGARIRIVDAGAFVRPATPSAGEFLQLRFNDPDQSRWQIGDGDIFRQSLQASPKMRVPAYRQLFKGYSQANCIHAHDFQLVGAMAPGGLSNAWGCSVARFRGEELGALRVEESDMETSYARVAGRMGLSGSSDDPLRSALGVDDWCAAGVPLDGVHERLWRRRAAAAHHIQMGRARGAVLTEPQGQRLPCDRSGTCLWGCHRGAMWSAYDDAESLSRASRVQFDAGVRVESIRANQDGTWTVSSLNGAKQARAYISKRVLLCAGTVVTTRLVLGALNPSPPIIRLQSNPIAAFMLLVPRAIGSPREQSFGLAQLSFLIQGSKDGENAFGSLYATGGLPVSEFLTHVPLRRRAALPMLRSLLPAMSVGNVFMPGRFSNHTARLDSDGGLEIRGGDDSALTEALSVVRDHIKSGFRRMGAYIIPGSFVRGVKGGDFHYACTLPISLAAKAHECRLSGEVAGLPGVYALDGSSLPLLPAKAHTLTIMANADRIARRLPLEHS
ncbi:MAG: FAD-dependent oxidoreductase [Chloroflexota bacterium]|nr:FAD-dependent oxidoreductase [Chloroflexota bacterium]